MYDIIQLLQHHAAMYLLIVGMICLAIGSFLNVIIARLPIMMENFYQAQCEDYLDIKKQDLTKVNKHFNLFTPSSHCPKCKHTIHGWENIPILSFIFLQGKCHYCKQPISLKYPIIEALTAALSILVAWNFGVELITIHALLLVWILLTQAIIDLEHTFIPDEITIPAIWAGLLINSFAIFCSPVHAIIGAIIGYLALWIVYWLFKFITNKDGMGYGDFKLLAMLGAWLGWQNLPLIIILSSLLGSIIGIILIITKNKKFSSAIPFGPYLAIAGIVALLYGTKINNLYMQCIGIF